MIKKIIHVVFIFCLLVGSYVFYLNTTLPNVGGALKNGITPSPASQILARDNSLIRTYGKFHHESVPLSEIPPDLIDALLSTEDRRFYQHDGIDPLGILRAFVQNFRSQRIREGGSTLTQQLARNVFLSNEFSINRKIKEALLARKLEQKLDKKHILEMYLNNVYFGEGAYGIGAASHIYFGKSPEELDKAECALLVGLLQAPSRYNPFNNPDLAINRRNDVLQNMVETRRLSKSDAQILKERKIRLNSHGKDLGSAHRAPFFSQYVVKQVLDQLDMDEQTFWQQGIKVYTTLDPDVQEVAEDQIRRLSRTSKGHQAALLSLDTDGGVIAYVGGRDFKTSQYDRVSQSRRSVGSLFKVFIYTTAMEKGISPSAVYQDSPVRYGSWRPENYDKRHYGNMTLAHALVKSNNVVAVKLLQELSPERVIKTAQKMGIKSPMQPNLSLALGAVDMSLMETTAAFNVLNNKGVYVEPYAITKIVGRHGELLYKHRPSRQKVLKRSARDTMVELMRGVINYGTGRAAAIEDHPAAGKTGTSDDNRDTWFIGFTPEVTTGVWVGNDNNSPMVGITGGTLPAKIWQAYMSRMLDETERRDFELAEAYPLEKEDFFSYNLNNPREPDHPWDKRLSGLGKRFQEWFHHLKRENTSQAHSDSEFRGMHEWDILKGVER